MPFIVLYPLLIVFLLFNEALLEFSKVSEAKKTKFYYVLFILLFLVSALRFDTTSDYDNYVLAFLKLQSGQEIQRYTLGYIWLNRLFVSLEYGYIFVFIICSFISYWMIFKLFLKEKVVVLGFIFFILFNLFKDYDNIVRQTLSISCFIYAIRFIVDGKLIKYVICALVASLFHYSSILAFLPFYFLGRFFMKNDFSFYFWLIVLPTLYALYVLGLFSNLTYKLLSLIPKYADYAENLKLISRGQLSTGLGILFWVIVALFIAFYKNRLDHKQKFYANMAIMSVVLLLLLNSFVILERMVKYLYVFRVLAIALIIKTIRWKDVPIYALMLLSSLIFWTRETYGYYGMNSYKTIFHSDRKDWIFWDRKRSPFSVHPQNQRKDKVILKL